MPDRTAGRPQNDPRMLLPWLFEALADAKNSHPASAGRLKAAAMQLLPPLLDGLHARRVSSLLDWGHFVNTVVGTALLCKRMHKRTSPVSNAQADIQMC